MRLGFKEWLAKDAPAGAGEIWDNRSNADLNFGRTGAKAKNVSPNRAEPSGVDPDRLYLGRRAKMTADKLNTNSNIGGSNGTDQRQPTHAPGHHL